MSIKEFPLVPLVFDAGADDPLVEWWRVARDAFERLGWGFAKAKRTADEAMFDAAVKLDGGRVSGPGKDTISRRAKKENWKKGSVSVKTPDERREQTAPAVEERRRVWAESRVEMANIQAEIAFKASSELLAYFDQSIEERSFTKSVGEASMSFEDGSARAQRTATVMGIAIDKADQLLIAVEDASKGDADQETRDDKTARLAPLFRKIEEGIEQRTG